MIFVTQNLCCKKWWFHVSGANLCYYAVNQEVHYAVNQEVRGNVVAKIFIQLQKYEFPPTS